MPQDKDLFANPPAPGLWFWTAQWNWIVKCFQALHAAHGAELADLGAIKIALGGLMTQDAELSAAVTANTEAVAALQASLDPLTSAVSSEVADVQRLIGLLQAGPAPDPAVAEAISAVQASTAALEAVNATVSAQTAALGADDSAAASV